MANPEDVGILLQGVARWNDWRKDKDGPSLDLSKADLRNRELTGADLRAVNLSGAVLRGAKIGPGSSLWNANLSEADLYGANLRGADLQDVNFSSADLFQTDLRESNLQGADLSTAKGGLLSKQLAGSDLTGAKLPEPLAKLYDSLSSVKEISDSAQKLFLALLAGCLYSWLTIAQTTDVDLITNRASTPLPIIQASIPIVGFYVVAPLILLCLYFYFHFYLQKLWEELGSLPAVFTDGRELHKRTDPWLLNDLVRSHFAKLKDGRPFLSYFQEWVSVALAWWLVPITLFLFWGRYLRRHDLIWAVFHALILTISIVAAFWLYRLAGGTLRGYERPSFILKEVLKHRSRFRRCLLTSVLVVVLVLISVGTIFGTPADTSTSFMRLTKSRELEFYIPSRRTLVPRLMELVGYDAFANLRNADVSTKPPNWTNGKPEELDLVKGANLQRSDLPYIRAEGAFLARARLQGANLYGASLVYADLREADLSYADVRKANFAFALMQRANMVSARLRCADLRAQLDGADLTDASMVESNLFRADLTSAKLVRANVEGALFYETVLKYTDLREAKGLTAGMIANGAIDWQLAFFDPDLLKQLSLPSDHNQKLEQQMKAEQQGNTAELIPANKSKAPVGSHILMAAPVCHFEPEP